MPKVVGVRFHGRGKVFDFDPQGFELKQADLVVVETSHGLELGVTATAVYERAELSAPLKPVLRLASDEDVETYEANCRQEEEAFRVCKRLIQQHELEMNLVAVEYTLDGQKILFFFTSEERVDFRHLVRDLAAQFHRRIELRQIGVRDEARLLGGLASCGRPFCCSSFLDDFVSVSVKMAKTQSLSMNQSKISGACGRLMCCLKYEQEGYEEAKKRAPKQGTEVKSEHGSGKVVAVDLLREQALVHLFNEEQSQERIPFAELRWEKNGPKQVQGKSGCACGRGGEQKCQCPKRRERQGKQDREKVEQS